MHDSFCWYTNIFLFLVTLVTFYIEIVWARVIEVTEGMILLTSQLLFSDTVM